MRNLLEQLRRLPLSQQVALTASTCCLVATLALVALAAKSSLYSRINLQRDYGTAVAEQLARSLSSELAAGDRLGIAGELARLVDQPGIVFARALDIEGTEIAAAGDREGGYRRFDATIRIAGDSAGSAEVTINTAPQDAAQLQFLLTLSGLAILLSIAVYAVTRTMAQRIAHNLSAVSAELAEVTGDDQVSANEIQALRERVAALPLELLKPHVVSGSSNDHYVDTAILYIYLYSLPGYVDTIDQRRLQRYVAMVHRMIFGAAGFYGGQLEVVREFGLAIYFDGKHRVGSPALRAASCAWLIAQAAPKLEQQLRLSVNLSLVVGGSELGRGDSRDIYPGLYIQSSLEELASLADQQRQGIALSEFVTHDVDLSTRIEIDRSDNGSAHLGNLADGHRDLLERQLQLLLKAVLEEIPGANADAPESADSV